MQIEEAYEKMSNEEKGQFIDGINNALINCLYGTKCKVNHEHKDFKDFLNGFVRDDEEVIDHNIECSDIRCPREFLNEKAIIESDNDYMCIVDGWHLNTNWIFECGEFDDLVANGILINL